MEHESHNGPGNAWDDSKGLFFKMMSDQEIMIEPVYFDTCLCFYFDKNFETAQNFENRSKYRCRSYRASGAPIILTS